MGMFTNQMDHGQVAWRWTTHTDGRRNIHLDPTQHGVVCIEAEHHEVHEGHMYHYSVIDTDVDITGPFTVTITTPTEYALGESYKSAVHGGETYVHFAAEIYADSQVTIEFIEGPTSVTGGADVTANVHNRNRDQGDSNLQSTVNLGGTVSGGTTLSTGVTGVSGNTQRRAGGNARTSMEWMLAHNTEYSVKITAAQDDTVVGFSMDFYEHIHKDDWNEEEVQGAM